MNIRVFKKIYLYLFLTYTGICETHTLGLFTDRNRKVYMQGEIIEVAFVVIANDKIENQNLMLEIKETSSFQKDWEVIVNKKINMDKGSNYTYLFRIDTNFIKPAKYQLRGNIEKKFFTKILQIELVSNIFTSNFSTFFQSLENGQSRGGFFTHDGVLGNHYYKDDPEFYAQLLEKTGINLVYEPFARIGEIGKKDVSKNLIPEEDYIPTIEQNFIESLLRHRIRFGVFPGRYWEKISFSDPILPMAVFLIPKYQEEMIKRVSLNTQFFRKFPHFFGFNFMADTCPGWSYWQIKETDPHYQVWQDIVKEIKKKSEEEIGLNPEKISGDVLEVNLPQAKNHIKWVDYAWSSLPFTFKLYNETSKKIKPDILNTTSSSGAWVYYWPFFCPPNYVFKELQLINAWHHNENSGLDFLRTQFDIDIAKSAGKRKTTFGLSSFYTQRPGPENRSRDLWLSVGRRVDGIGQSNWPMLADGDITSYSLYMNGRYRHTWEEAGLTYKIFSIYGDMLKNFENRDTVTLLISPLNNEANPPRIDIYKQIEAYVVLRMANIPVRAVLESEVRENGLPEHSKILFLVALPKTNYNLFDEKMKKEILNFISHGGKVIADKESSVWDIPGLIKTDISFERYPIINCTDNSKIVWLRNQNNIIKLKEVLNPIIPDFPQGEKIICQTLYGSDNSILLIVASNKMPEYGNPQERIPPFTSLLKLNGLSGYLYDLFNHKFIGKIPEDLKDINVDFNRYPVNVYLILPSLIEKVKVKLSIKYDKGIFFETSILNTHGELLNTPIPIEVLLNDPEKKIRYLLYRATKDGYYKEYLPLATNDSSGEWLFEVKELITGKSVSISFQYTPVKKNYVYEVDEGVLIFDKNSVRDFLKGKEKVIIVFGEDYLFKIANEIKQKLEKNSIKVELKKPEEVITGDVSSDHMRSFIHPFYITEKANLILLGNPGNNKLIDDINQSDILPRLLSKNYPGYGRGAIFYVWSPFVGGYDVLCLIGYSENEVNMAASSFIRLLDLKPSKNEINNKFNNLQDNFDKTYEKNGTYGNISSALEGYPVKPISDLIFDSKNNLIVGSVYGNNLFYFDKDGNLLWCKKVGAHSVIRVESLKDKEKIIAVTSALLKSAVGKDGRPWGDHFGTVESINFPRLTEKMDKTFILNPSGEIKNMFQGALSLCVSSDGTIAVGGWDKVFLINSSEEIIFSWDNWAKDFPLLLPVIDIDYDPKQKLLSWIAGDKTFLADIEKKRILWEDRVFSPLRVKIFPEGKVIIWNMGTSRNKKWKDTFLVIRNLKGEIVYRSLPIPLIWDRTGNWLSFYYNVQFLKQKDDSSVISSLDKAVIAVTDGWSKISFLDEKLKEIWKFETDGTIFVNKPSIKFEWAGNISWDAPPSAVRPIPGFDITSDRKLIAVVDDQHKVYLLDDAGNLLWKKLIGSGFQVSFSSDGEKIAVAGWKGDLTILNKKGDILWQEDLRNFSEKEQNPSKVLFTDNDFEFIGSLDKKNPQNLPENLLKSNSSGRIIRGKRPEKNDITWLVDGEVKERTYPHLSEDANTGATPDDNKRGATFTAYNLPSTIEIYLDKPKIANLICVWDTGGEKKHYVSDYKIEILTRSQKSDDFIWQILVQVRGNKNSIHSHSFKPLEVKGIRYTIASTDDGEIWTEEIGLYYYTDISSDAFEFKPFLVEEHKIIKEEISSSEINNLFKNAGFEKGSVDWFFGKGVVLDNEVFHGGNFSVRVNPEVGPGAVLISNIPAGSGYGKFREGTYRISFWAKGKPETGWDKSISATLLLEKDIDKVVQTVYINVDKSSYGEKGWIKFSSTFKMPKEVVESKKAYYYFTIWIPKIAYTIWFDDFELVYIGE